jgi:hypothetical protein
LFLAAQEVPIWTPVNRGEEADVLPCRGTYIKSFQVEDLKSPRKRTQDEVGLEIQKDEKKSKQ